MKIINRKINRTYDFKALLLNASVDLANRSISAYSYNRVIRFLKKKVPDKAFGLIEIPLQDIDQNGYYKRM